MHKQIMELVSSALKTIETELKQEFPEDTNEKLKSVVAELVKIKHDSTDHFKGYHYYTEAWDMIGIKLNQSENDTLWDSITDISFLLNEMHKIYPHIVKDENQQNPREFIQQTSEELYNYLLGVAELGQYE
jgi:hypothetical protein